MWSDWRCVKWNNEPLSMPATDHQGAGGPHFHMFCLPLTTLDRVIISAECSSATSLLRALKQNIFLFENFKTKSSV